MIGCCANWWCCYNRVVNDISRFVDVSILFIICITTRFHSMVFSFYRRSVDFLVLKPACFKYLDRY